MSAKLQYNDERSIGSASRLFCESPPGNVRGLDSVRVSNYCPRGTVLFSEGQKANGVFVLSEGRAKISIASAEGKVVVLRVAGPGEMLGVMSTLTNKPYCATAETLERSRIHFIPRASLMELIDRDRDSYLAVAQSLSRGFSGLVEQVRLLLLSRSATEKLARFLIGRCDETGKRTSQGIRLDSNLSHEEIAQIICTSRETVTRVLGDFKRKRLVSLVGKVILVHDRKGLELLARC